MNNLHYKNVSLHKTPIKPLDEDPVTPSAVRFQSSDVSFKGSLKGPDTPGSAYSDISYLESFKPSPHKGLKDHQETVSMLKTAQRVTAQLQVALGLGKSRLKEIEPFETTCKRLEIDPKEAGTLLVSLTIAKLIDENFSLSNKWNSYKNRVVVETVNNKDKKSYISFLNRTTKTLRAAPNAESNDISLFSLSSDSKIEQELIFAAHIFGSLEIQTVLADLLFILEKKELSDKKSHLETLKFNDFAAILGFDINSVLDGKSEPVYDALKNVTQLLGIISKLKDESPIGEYHLSQCMTFLETIDLKNPKNFRSFYFLDGGSRKCYLPDSLYTDTNTDSLQNKALIRTLQTLRGSTLTFYKSLYKPNNIEDTATVFSYLYQHKMFLIPVDQFWDFVGQEEMSSFKPKWDSLNSYDVNSSIERINFGDIVDDRYVKVMNSGNEYVLELCSDNSTESLSIIKTTNDIKLDSSYLEDEHIERFLQTSRLLWHMHTDDDMELLLRTSRDDFNPDSYSMAAETSVLYEYIHENIIGEEKDITLTKVIDFFLSNVSEVDVPVFTFDENFFYSQKVLKAFETLTNYLISRFKGGQDVSNEDSWIQSNFKTGSLTYLQTFIDQYCYLAIDGDAQATQAAATLNDILNTLIADPEKGMQDIENLLNNDNEGSSELSNDLDNIVDEDSDDDESSIGDIDDSKNESEEERNA